MGLGSVDAERKLILARMTFPIVLIQEFTHNVACLKNRDLLGRFEGPIWGMPIFSKSLTKLGVTIASADITREMVVTLFNFQMLYISIARSSYYLIFCCLLT